VPLKASAAPEPSPANAAPNHKEPRIAHAASLEMLPCAPLSVPLAIDVAATRYKEGMQRQSTEVQATAANTARAYRSAARHSRCMQPARRCEPCDTLRQSAMQRVKARRRGEPATAQPIPQPLSVAVCFDALL